MGKFIYLANIIAADVDFYNIEGNRGDSYLPFIGFMMFVVGAVVAFMGFSKYITAKKNFNLFYDLRDSVKVDNHYDSCRNNCSYCFILCNIED